MIDPEPIAPEDYPQSDEQVDENDLDQDDGRRLANDGGVVDRQRYCVVRQDGERDQPQPAERFLTGIEPDQTEGHDQGQQEDQSLQESAAQQVVLVVPVKLHLAGDRLCGAQHWRLVHPAGVGAQKPRRAVHPHANRNRNDAAADTLRQWKPSRLGIVGGDVTFPEGAKFPDQFAVYEDLVRIIRIVRHLQRQRLSGPRYINPQPIPRIPRVPGISHRSPSWSVPARTLRRSQVHRSPSRIVEIRLGPCHVVAGMEFPGTVQVCVRAPEFDPADGRRGHTGLLSHGALGRRKADPHRNQ